MAKDISADEIERGYPRAAGLFLIFLGAGLLYWLAWLPVQDAQHHATHIQLSLKGTVVGTVLLLVGLLKLVFGPAATPFLKPEGDGSKIPAIIVGVLVLGAGFGLHHALKDYLKLVDMLSIGRVPLALTLLQLRKTLTSSVPGVEFTRG